jgi:hypothetical protein
MGMAEMGLWEQRGRYGRRGGLVSEAEDNVEVDARLHRLSSRGLGEGGGHVEANLKAVGSEERVGFPHTSPPPRIG